MQPTEKSTEFWLCFGLLLVLGGWTRFKEVDQPAWVCWDETHFGKMGSWYINRTFFFDVHPPLGKMIIGGVGYLTGYNGTFAFEKPGDLYHDHNYLGMRLACTFLGACLIPFSFLTVWEFTHSINAAFFAGILIVFGKSKLSVINRNNFLKVPPDTNTCYNVSDIGMLTLNQYILLDPILLFFISGATYAMSKFRNLSNQEFTFKWYLWLSLMGAFIGCAFSVKFVGLFVILLIGINTIAQLWDIMGDLSKPFTHTIKHFIARAFCLIALPIVLYITFFYIHLSVLYKS